MFLLISMPPEFSLMPRFKSISFHRKNSKIKLFLHKNKIFQLLGATPPDPHRPPAELPDPQKSLSPLHISAYAHDTKRVLPWCCSYFEIIEFYNEKLLSKPNNNRYLQ